MKTKIVIANATATELKPDAKYLIGLDRSVITLEDAHNLLTGLKNIGIENAIVLVVKGDPTKVIKIIEQDIK